MPNVRRSMMAAAGAAGGGSTSGAVYFDGTTDLSRGADLTGLSGSDYVTWSYWYKIHAAGTPADFFSLINLKMLLCEQHLNGNLNLKVLAMM